MKKDNHNLMTYFVLNTLYFNDTVCNNIKTIASSIATQDKETRKIYGALKKRANAYLRSVSKSFGDKIMFYASYCGDMDSSCDVLVDNLRSALEKAFAGYNVPNAKLLAQIELVRCLSDIAVSLVETYISYGKTRCSEVFRLRNFQLRDIQRVANNLAIWAQRDIHPKDEDIDLARDKTVASAVDALCGAFSSYEIYNAAIDTARREEKENGYEEENKHSSI